MFILGTRKHAPRRTRKPHPPTALSYAHVRAHAVEGPPPAGSGPCSLWIAAHDPLPTVSGLLGSQDTPTRPVETDTFLTKMSASLAIASFLLEGRWCYSRIRKSTEGLIFFLLSKTSKPMRMWGTKTTQKQKEQC